MMKIPEPLRNTLASLQSLRKMVVGLVLGPIGVLSMMRGAEIIFKDRVNYQ